MLESIFVVYSLKIVCRTFDPVEGSDNTNDSCI